MKLQKQKKADLELDELGKLIIGLVLLIVLIVIVTVVIKTELFNSGDKVLDVFSIFG
jgi:t-SNARE complex subunit (syntaxin)